MMQTVKIRHAPPLKISKLALLSVTVLFGGIIGIFQPPMYAVLLVVVPLLIGYLALRLRLFEYRQPRYDLVLCYDHLQFHHLYGGWTIPWQAITRVGIPNIGRGFARQDLNYIGLKIDDYASILDNVSPRLCAHLLTEQRAALLCALKAEETLSDEISDALFEDDRYRSDDKRLYTGLVGMFGNRMAKLRSLTGFDLLIETNHIDRTQQELITLMHYFKRHCADRPSVHPQAGS